MLGDIGTLASYQRRGVASALARWPLDDADEGGLDVYLDTGYAGNAKGTYESLGFKRNDIISIAPSTALMASIPILPWFGSRDRSTKPTVHSTPWPVYESVTERLR